MNLMPKQSVEITQLLIKVVRYAMILKVPRMHCINCRICLLLQYTTFKSDTDRSVCKSSEDCLGSPFELMDANIDFEQMVLMAIGIGITKDSRKIMGPYSDAGEIWQPSDVDICNEKIIDGEYVYLTTQFYPYTVGCWGPAETTVIVTPSCTANARTITTVLVKTSSGEYLQSAIYMMVAFVMCFMML